MSELPRTPPTRSTEATSVGAADAEPQPSAARPGPLRPRERAEIGGLALLSLCVSVATAWLALGTPGFSSLGAYFDGHYYIDVARSFPLPFAPEAGDYLSRPPAYPALIFLFRQLTPDFLNWGSVALFTNWLCSVAAVCTFYLLCREVAIDALSASLCFLLVNPVWPLLTSAAHAEPLATAAALACFLAYLRGSLPWAAVFLSLAILSRFQALLLGLPLAFDLLVVRRSWTLRSLAWLLLPLLAFALYNLYLREVVPGVVHVVGAHRVHWDVGLVWPFRELLAFWERSGSLALFQRPILYGSVALYLLASLVAFRPAEWKRAWLGVWVASVLLFHVCLSGSEAASSFTRLAVLAWPPALLIVWRWVPRAAALPTSLALGLAGASLGLWVSFHQIRAAVFLQNQYSYIPRKVQELAQDEVRWINIEEERLVDYRKSEQEKRRKRAEAAERFRP